MAVTHYPYKIRAQFTETQERGLRAASAQHGESILSLIRRYVVEGLARDGITGTPPGPVPGQEEIFPADPAKDDA